MAKGEKRERESVCENTIRLWAKYLFYCINVFSLHTHTHTGKIDIVGTEGHKYLFFFLVPIFIFARSMNEENNLNQIVNCKTFSSLSLLSNVCMGK